MEEESSPSDPQPTPEPLPPAADVAEDSGAGSSSEIPIDLPAPAGEADELPEPEILNPKGTAQTIAGGVEMLAAMSGKPLEGTEYKDLERDLLPVLRKHGVPNFDGGPEVKLAATSLRIAWPRWFGPFFSWVGRQLGLVAPPAPPDGKEVPSDQPVPRKEGQREERAMAQAVLARFDGPKSKDL